MARLNQVFSFDRKRRWMLQLLILCIATAKLTATPPLELKQLIPDANTRAMLLKKGVQVSMQSGETLTLVPELPNRHTIVEPFETMQTTYGAEILRLIPIDYMSFDWLTLYNHLRAVSTLQGIQYYSNSRSEYRTLFERSHAIVDATDRTPQADPVSDKIPNQSSLFLVQEDLTFGSNVYQADYEFDGLSITMNIHNLTTMWWTILPLVGVGNFHSVVSATPTDRGLLFYAAAGIHSLDLDIIRDRGQKSLSNRLNALEHWLRKLLYSPAISVTDLSYEEQ